MVSLIERIENNSDLNSVEKDLRFLASNKRTLQVSELIDKAIEKCKKLGNKKTLVLLYGHKILIIYNYRENIQLASDIIDEMLYVSEEIEFKEGMAWALSYKWYIEKFKGNKKASTQALVKAMSIIRNTKCNDEYIYNFVQYSYAMERWLEEHDTSIIKILEECLDFYYNNGFYRSFAQSLGFLGIIHIRYQNSKEILYMSKKIIANRTFFNSLQSDIQGIIYYFIGLGYLLNANLSFAETYFSESDRILKPQYKKTIYFSNYIILQSHIATVKALQGRLEESLIVTKEVEKLLEQDFFNKNLELNTKKQIFHTLNLNKFYVYSRFKEFNSKEMQDLIEEIYEGCKNLYSDFMLLSEFILNANLEYAKMKNLITSDNFSLNRVKHIISFIIQKRDSKEESNDRKHLQRIEILNKRERNEKTTFIENALADLLIAQQLFLLKQYEEIYALLRKYEKQLHRIEVLELRVFMEAFIQVGAYKNGDSLGPALQYMAIKKCRQYGFSRLENNLLDYLNMQRNDALRLSS